MGVEGASILSIGKCAHKITANAPEVFPFYTIYVISLFLLIGNANNLVLVGGCGFSGQQHNCSFY